MPNILGVIHHANFETRLGALYPHCAIHSDDPLVRNLVEGDVAYVVVEQSTGELWLVYVFEHPRPSETGKFFAPNSIPVTDVTRLGDVLRVPSIEPGDRPYFALSAEASTEFEAIWRPMREKQEADRARSMAEFAAAEKARKARNAAAKKAARLGTRKPTRTETFGLLVDGAVAQIEEVAGEVQEDAEVMLLPPVYAEGMGLRGHFTETVQNIIDGGGDVANGLRLLGEELSPFVDGSGLTIVLNGLPKGALSPEALVPALVDAFSIRAVDDLARTLVALAVGKKKMIPARCEELLPLLEGDVERVRAILG